MDDDLVATLPRLGGVVTVLLLFLTAAFFLLLLIRCKSIGDAASLLRKLSEPVLAMARERGRPSSSHGARRGLSIQVTDRAVARRALVQHSAAFLDRPATSVPSTILTRNRHHNILSAPYGPYWRAVRSHAAAGVLHPSRLGLLRDARARVLGDLVRALRSGAPAGESLHFAVYSVLAEMCFGEDIVSELGEARLRDMHKFQREVLLALPSFWVFAKYPRIGRFLYPSRWRQLLALRRQQEESFLPLVDEVGKRKAWRRDSNFTSYVESLLELRVHEAGDRKVTDGEPVSLIEFLGAGTESTASALEWTMANLVKHPELQRKLRLEVDAVAASRNDRNRTIEATDLPRMPYLKAVVLESLRRHPPVPFVLRHVKGLDADAAWSDPMSFTPERFMPGGEGEGGVDLTCTRELKMMPFGAGRRICPGLAPAMLYLEHFVANLVREFEWWEVDGEEVDLAEFHGSFFTVMNRPLRARLVPRDVAAAARLAM